MLVPVLAGAVEAVRERLELDVFPVTATAVLTRLLHAGGRVYDNKHYRFNSISSVINNTSRN